MKSLSLMLLMIASTTSASFAGTYTLTPGAERANLQGCGGQANTFFNEKGNVVVRYKNIQYCDSYQYLTLKNQVIGHGDEALPFKGNSNSADVEMNPEFLKYYGAVKVRVFASARRNSNYFDDLILFSTAGGPTRPPVEQNICTMSPEIIGSTYGIHIHNIVNGSEHGGFAHFADEAANEIAGLPALYGCKVSKPKYNCTLAYNGIYIGNQLFTAPYGSITAQSAYASYRLAGICQ